MDAREKLLEITRKCIFEQGMGIDPDPQNFGNSSGVALQFLYSLLEQKAGLQETEFKLGFGRFIRCICRLNNIQIKDDTIVQTWTRTSVKNDQELSQIATQSKGVISDETIVAHHHGGRSGKGNGTVKGAGRKQHWRIIRYVSKSRRRSEP